MQQKFKTKYFMKNKRQRGGFACWNILIDDSIVITCMRLCKPANYNSSENTKNNIYRNFIH